MVPQSTDLPLNMQLHLYRVFLFVCFFFSDFGHDLIDMESVVADDCRTLSAKVKPQQINPCNSKHIVTAKPVKYSELNPEELQTQCKSETDLHL